MFKKVWFVALALLNVSTFALNNRPVKDDYRPVVEGTRPVNDGHRPVNEG